MDAWTRVLLIVCPLVFLAGFVDSVAGGGGIISLPAYLFAGLPAHFAAGTNKMAMSLGTGLSAYKYMRGGKVMLRIALFSAVGAIVGSAIGTKLALLVSDHTLKVIMLTALPIVAVFLATKKDFGKDPEPVTQRKSTQGLLSFFIGVFIGCYDGLVGPGTGTFLILAFTGFLKIDLLTSSGCAKVSNLASNITSMLIYLLSGKVLFTVAIPAAVFCMAGNYTGAHFAMKGGSKNVRSIMFIVLILLFVKTAIDFLGR